MKRISICFALLFFSLTSAAARADQLLVNGGFETGDFTGWTQGGNTGSTSVWGGTGVANSGFYAAALGPVGSLGTLSQTLNTTAGGALYLNFFLANPSGATPNSFAVSLDGLNVQLGAVGAQPYKLYSFQTTASGASTSLTFTFQNDPSYLMLDDVSVTTSPTDPTTWPAGNPPVPPPTPIGDPLPGGVDPVSLSTASASNSLPEPGSLTLLGVGALALLFSSRTRKTPMGVGNATR